MKKTYPELEALNLLIRVTEEGNFSSVAKKLHIPKATLSRKIAQLENLLGAQLLVRTTRSLGLTEAGRGFLQKAKTALSAMDEAQATLSKARQQEPQGTLRITAGVEFGVSILSPLLDRFCRKYPRIQLELDLTGRSVDLVYEGFDVGIRIGTLEDSTYSARKLGSFSYGLYASPKLLAKSKIHKPSDLTNFPSLLFSRGTHREAWRLIRGHESESLAVTPRVLSNNHWVLKNAARSGLGIAFMPEFLAQKEVHDKSLIRVLPGWSSARIPIHALYPAQRHVPLKVRALIDYLASNMSVG